MTERELRARLEAAEEEIQTIKTELSKLNAEFDRVRDEFRYLPNELEGAAKEIRNRIKTCEEKLRRVEKLRAELIKQLEQKRKASEEARAKARKRLPDVVRRFYQRRRELVEALVESVSDLKERLKPMEKAVERYYGAGESVVEVAREAGEYHGGGWVFAANDLSPAARRLWRAVIAKEKLPEGLQVDEETLDLLRWWISVVERLPQLRSDFPPAFMTLETRRRLEEERQRHLQALEERLRRRRTQLARYPVEGGEWNGQR